MRGHREAVRRRQGADAGRLADAARDGDVRLQDVHRAQSNEVAEGKARLLALAGRDRDVGRRAHLGLSGGIVG